MILENAGAEWKSNTLKTLALDVNGRTRVLDVNRKLKMPKMETTPSVWPLTKPGRHSANSMNWKRNLMNRLCDPLSFPRSHATDVDILQETPLIGSKNAETLGWGYHSTYSHYSLKGGGGSLPLSSIPFSLTLLHLQIPMANMFSSTACLLDACRLTLLAIYILLQFST